MRQWRDLHERANRQGFVTRADVRELELAGSSFTEHGRGLGWSPWHRGLWVPPGLTWDHVTAAQAASRVLGETTMMTAGTALFINGALDTPPPRVEVLVDAPRSPAKREGICVHHTTAFAQVRYHNRMELRVAAVPRALADYAAHCAVDELCRVIAAATRLRLCTLAAVRQELDKRRRFPGRRNLRIALSLLATELVHSASERLARRLLRDAGHRPSTRPYPVEHGGRIVAEIDVAFPPCRYGAEIDGPHHLLPGVASADRSRDRLLVDLGWTIDRFWWDEIEQRSVWFVQEVTRQLTRLGRG
ncbi:MAG: hypothetical protein GEU74_16400 [Nitriliruptorales bacterium]|nr:hypothetical protein [Nitriliruptorales bacterium]